MYFKSPFFKFLTLGALVLVLNSCSDDTTEPVPSQPFDKGLFIINAGNFGDNNGSITFFEPTLKMISYDIFQTQNTRSLAGGARDYVEVDGKGLIPVDNMTPGKDLVEIVTAGTFKSVGTIPSTEVENPRYVAKAGANKAYVSCWDTFNEDYSYKPGYLVVVDLVTNKVTKKIVVEKGAEKLLVSGSEVIVGSVGGDKTITFINTQTDAPARSVEVGINPDLIGIDANGKLWLYAGGELVKFNLSSKTVESRIKIVSPVAGKSAGNFAMSKDKQTVFYVNSFYDPADGYKLKGETYSFGVNDATVLAIKPFINRLFTGLGVDPSTGILYAGFTPSYKQAGYVIRYQPNGTLIDSLKAEIAPSGFFFK
ncbi:YncE family protein [Emticicia sp. CRIBPO]|uniref:YncE family protein n=1 Tax=Emticicia sp. CRIBPO TaxID=2683258 RepID=UPI001E53D3D3|nr:DUF5074 domain-containing protein [Emticicia sp. CRIBPO]